MTNIINWDCILMIVIFRKVFMIVLVKLALSDEPGVNPFHHMSYILAVSGKLYRIGCETV